MSNPFDNKDTPIRILDFDFDSFFAATTRRDPRDSCIVCEVVGPPTQVMVGLALFLTVFIMTPVWQDINSNSLQPYLDQKISQKQAYENALVPIRSFMFNQTREKDLGLFLKMANVPKPNDYSDVPTHVLIPAFIISEFRIAFQIGFLLFIPFLMLDMIVASVLMSMSMMMLPPVMISLPFKLLLFVLVDGWYLVVESIITGFN